MKIRSIGALQRTSSGGGRHHAALAATLVGALLTGCAAGSPTTGSAPLAADTVSSAPHPSPRPSASPGSSASPAPSPAPSTSASKTISPERQADLNRRLIAAAWKNDRVAARRLIEAGADVNAKDDTQQSAYLIATSEGYLDLLELTLDHGADVRSLDSYAGTGLIRAADRGHVNVVGRLLQTDIRVDHVNNLGWTALHEAILLGDGSQRYVDTVRLLVAGGADVRLRSNRDQVSPLAHAHTKGYAVIARTLEKAGRSEKAGARKDPNKTLLNAAASGDADGVALALRAGARIESRDERRRTPLMLAAAADRVPVARLLVALGADPDALDSRHDTPWLVTGVTGSVDMAEVLLAAGPDLSQVNRFGGTSLIPASERGHVAYVRRLLRTDIDVNHVNNLGWTALLEAVILGDGSKRYTQIVDALLDGGADPGLADANGTLPIQHARQKGHREIVRILEAAG